MPDLFKADPLDPPNEQMPAMPIYTCIFPAARHVTDSPAEAAAGATASMTTGDASISVSLDAHRDAVWSAGTVAMYLANKLEYHRHPVLCDISFVQGWHLASAFVCALLMFKISSC